MDYRETFAKWQEALRGTEYEAEMEAIGRDESLMEDSFYQYLAFGTAGMRGTLALGTNRMNIFTVRRCTQGLVEYVRSIGRQADGIAIAYDSRNMSAEFALETALVLAAGGVKAYLYDTLHSVPQLSFTILELGCAGGVVITASHNPPEYNGYKVYGADGGQLATEDAAIMTKFIESAGDLFAIQPMEKQAALDAGLLQYIGAEIDEIYFRKVRSLVIDEAALASQADSLKIVYTPLFGSGNVPVRALLARIGIRNLHVVASQEKPNGDFPGLSAPNPENREVFTEAFALAAQTGANMIMATDPDCDRLGVAVRTQAGEWELLTGNQIGCILMDYILSARSKAFKGDEFVVKSVVSTNMADAIAAAYGVELRNVLTGFKFIAEQIKLAEATGKGTFCFGFEESFGYLEGTFVRDKDAAMSSMMLAEAACAYAAQGMTLFDALRALYAKYGYFKERVLSLTLGGIEGIASIQRAVETLRTAPPASFGGHTVTAISDFKTGLRTELATGKTSPTGLPETNMLYFELEHGRVILRPSGTEPKLKAYVSYSSADEAEAEANLQALADITDALMREYTSR